MRQIIKIDQEKCIGCSLCVNACMQDALQMVNGKATLVNDSYCDGLGMCLPQCPVDAISITETQKEYKEDSSNVKLKNDAEPSALKQWPVQLHLVRPNADFFKNSNILIAADCVPFALNNFHGTLLNKKSLVIACPKLDEKSNYVEKLAQIFSTNDIKTITIAIMEVPCCGGLDRLVKQALELSGEDIPLRTVVVNLDGTIR